MRVGTGPRAVFTLGVVLLSALIYVGCDGGRMASPGGGENVLRLTKLTALRKAGNSAGKTNQTRISDLGALEVDVAVISEDLAFAAESKKALRAVLVLAGRGKLVSDDSVHDIDEDTLVTIPLSSRIRIRPDGTLRVLLFYQTTPRAP